MGGIWLLSDQPNLSSSLEYDWFVRKVAHVAEFAVLMALWFCTWRASGSSRLVAFLMSAVITISYAGVDEWHQTWVTGRHGTPRDVAIDAVGIGLVSIWLLFRRWFRFSNSR